MTDSTKRDELAEAYCSKIETEDDYQKDALSFKAGFDAGVAESAEEIIRLKYESEAANSLGDERIRLAEARAEKAEAELLQVRESYQEFILSHQNFKNRAEKLAAALEKIEGHSNPRDVAHDVASIALAEELEKQNEAFRAALEFLITTVESEVEIEDRQDIKPYLLAREVLAKFEKATKE